MIKHQAPYARSAAPITDADLIRFLDAQDQIYQQVVDELANGRKETHWMWFIFPQLTGLGRSGMAQHYAIRDLDQANVIWLTRSSDHGCVKL
jgi:uncharacterized protein (DUF1810 family)